MKVVHRLQSDSSRMHCQALTQSPWAYHLPWPHTSHARTVHFAHTLQHLPFHAPPCLPCTYLAPTVHVPCTYHAHQTMNALTVCTTMMHLPLACACHANACTYHAHDRALSISIILIIITLRVISEVLTTMRLPCTCLHALTIILLSCAYIKPCTGQWSWVEPIQWQ